MKLEAQRYPAFFPGATTIGAICRKGVILASEKRVSYGYMIMSKSAKKVFRITDRIGAACAGLVSDMQVLVSEVEVYANLLRLETNRPPSTKAVAKSMSNVLFKNRLFPILAQTIVGGYDDDEGPSLYSLDPFGSVIKDKYTCIGTGSEIGIGVLEFGYREDMKLSDLRDLVIRSIKSAISRDAMSGNGIDLLLISKEGITEENIPL